MMINYNLCEYSKKFSNQQDDEVSKLRESKVDIIESHRIGLNSGMSRSFSKSNKNNFATFRNRFTLIPTR